MKLHNLYRYMAIVACGGAVFQATAGCSDQLSATVTELVVGLIINAVLSAVLGGIGT